MANTFDTRLARLEKYAPVVANDDRTNPGAMLQAFVDDNGGRIDNESWAGATARLLDMPYSEFMNYLRDRAAGLDK